MGSRQRSLNCRRAPPPVDVEYEDDEAGDVESTAHIPHSPFEEGPPHVEDLARPKLSARALSASMRRIGKSRRNAGDSRGMFPEIQPDDEPLPLRGPL